MAELRDLFAIVVFVVISAVFIIVPPLNATPLRAVLGFILVLFVPGYVFVSALFPGRDELNGIERLALSIGLSICIVIFIGIAVNYHAMKSMACDYAKSRVAFGGLTLPP